MATEAGLPTTAPGLLAACPVPTDHTLPVTHPLPAGRHGADGPHGAESGEIDHVYEIALLTRLAVYRDPSKLQLGISTGGTIAIPNSHILSQHFNADLYKLELTDPRCVQVHQLH